MLLTPQPKRKASTTRARTLNMPKHMTGEEFIHLMEQRKQEKEEEEAAKKRRKIEREEKKKERQMVQEEKAKLRQIKKLITAEKKSKEMAERNAKRLAKQKKKKTFIPPFSAPLVPQSTQSDCCAECGKEENDNEEWVSCDNCERWWHVQCTDTPSLSVQDFSVISWSCSSCRPITTKTPP
jgi:vacuolar-type H+-ATPase subunit I/STV1